MRSFVCSIYLTLFLIFICHSVSYSSTPVFLNRIEGMVFNTNRVPLNDVRIELLNELGSPLLNTKTSAGGRFMFSGITQGHFVVRVLPIGLDYLEESKDVDIVNFRRNGSDTVYVDFYLRNARRSQDVLNNQPVGTIFVQEIPPEAKRLYQSGVESLKNRQNLGLDQIEESVKIFPNYFDSLSLLGKEYIARSNFDKAIPYLVRAVNVNPRSAIDFYRLGVALNYTKQYLNALEAAKSTITLVPNSLDAQLLYGALLRNSKNYIEAEKTLQKANTLAKGKNSEVHWELALLYNRINKNQEAIKELEIFLALEPRSPDREKIKELIEKLKNAKSN